MGKKYHYFYKITNQINNKFYYGIHSTDNLDDGYMGSGIALKKAIEKYGVLNFKKEILKFFKTRKEASEYESEVVTFSLVEEKDCYNIVPGGEKYPCVGMVPAYNNDGEYVFVTEKNFHDNREKYKSLTEGKVRVKLKNENDSKFFYVNKETYYSNKDIYETYTTNKIIVKDKKNNFYIIDKNDERLKNGTFTSYWLGKKVSEETKRKVKETFKRIKHQQGIKNSQYGTRWIHKNDEIKKIKKEELEFYLNNGWKRGKVDKKVKEKKNPQYKLIDENKAFFLHDNGLTWNEIANEFGVTIGVINKFLRWKRYG